MENFVVTITCLLIGMTVKRIPDLSEETGNILNLFVIYISLPALVLLKIPELVFSKDLLIPSLMPWVMLLLSCSAILFLSKVLKWARDTTGCMLLLVPMGNTSFLGIPMVKAFFGDQAIPYAVLYDQLGSFLALATYGSFILAYYGTGAKNMTPVTVIKKILYFPAVPVMVASRLLSKSFLSSDVPGRQVFWPMVTELLSTAQKLIKYGVVWP
jgi:hypothetical protein